MLAAEKIEAAKSKGEVLVFRRGHELPVPPQEDEESTQVTEKVTEEPKLNKDEVAIQPQTKIFHWKDVCYDIKLKGGVERRLLDHVDGWVKPGTLTALMVRLSSPLRSVNLAHPFNRVYLAREKLHYWMFLLRTYHSFPCLAL